jgi:hypothetical protein
MKGLPHGKAFVLLYSYYENQKISSNKRFLKGFPLKIFKKLKILN